MEYVLYGFIVFYDENSLYGAYRNITNKRCSVNYLTAGFFRFLPKGKRTFQRRTQASLKREGRT